MFFEMRSLKGFTLFTGKHLCWDLFLIKLRLQLFFKIFLKEVPIHVFPVDIAKFLRTAFFKE